LFHTAPSTRRQVDGLVIAEALVLDGDERLRARASAAWARRIDLAFDGREIGEGLVRCGPRARRRQPGW
jgi:hypothetical protein